MKALVRYLTIATLGIAALTFVLINPAMTQKDNVSPADELDYPILLVHGLGEGPGEGAFGKLEELLEKYYFDVEVMDFNKYAKKKLAKNKDAATLGVQAAILGNEIRDVIDEYNQKKNTSVDRVHILAHSYGGLVVQAYLLNMGVDYDKKSGGYDENVAKVLYIQVPFYGVKEDSDTLGDLIDDTDYGPFLDKKVWQKTLTMGSDALVDMHNLLVFNNIYRPSSAEPYPDAATFVSEDDEILEVELGMLNAFMKKGQTHQFHQYSVFGGKFGSFSHSSNPISAAGKMNSLCWGENIDDDNVLAMASFFDNGRNWRKVGLKPTIETNIVVVKYEKKPGFNKVNDDDVTLTLKKKYVESSVTGANKKGEVIKGFFNETSRMFVFKNIAPGTYEIKIKNSKKGNLESDLEFDPGDVNSYAYDPKEHKLRKGGQFSPSAGTIFYMEELIFTKAGDQEELWAALPGLNTNGFAIEFDCRNGNMKLDKGAIFSFYNADGRSDDWRFNGGRVEFNFRGMRDGIITFYLVADANKDGAYYRSQEGYEISEIKSALGYDWDDEHHVKVVQQTIDGKAHIDVYVDDEHPMSFEEIAPYYNPNPIISFGCRFHNDSYFNPTGMILTNIIIYNIK